MSTPCNSHTPSPEARAEVSQESPASKSIHRPTAELFQAASGQAADRRAVFRVAIQHRGRDIGRAESTLRHGIMHHHGTLGVARKGDLGVGILLQSLLGKLSLMVGPPSEPALMFDSMVAG